MKFVCDRCQTKYSIADDKVRGKVLKVRCKTCQNVITVREAGAKPSEGSLAPVRSSQRPSSGALATLGEFHEDLSERTNISAAPAGLMADLIQGGKRPTPPPPPPVGRVDDIEWFLALEGAQQGPFSRKALVDRLLTMPKDSDVHVWNDAMDGWKAPSDVPEVARDLEARKPPAPPVKARTTPAPPLPPTSMSAPAPAARRGTMPLSSGLGASAKLNLPTPHVAAAHAVPAPHAEPAAPKPPIPMGGVAAAAAAPVSSPAPAKSTHVSSPAIPVKKNGANGAAAHAAVPAVPLTGGGSDPLSALNIDVAAPATASAPKAPTTPPRLMDMGAATAWSGSDRVDEGRHRNSKMLLGVLGVVVAVVVVIAMSMTKKAPAVVTAAPVKAGIDSEALGKLHEELSARKNEAPPPPVAQEAAAADPAKGKGLRGRNPTRGRQLPVVARGPALTGTTQVATETTAAAAPPAEPNNAFHERTVTPVAAVASRPPPSQGEITRVINNNKIGIKTCYQRALLRDSSLTHGKIVVGVTIGLSGRVKHVKVDGPSSFRTLEPCIREMVGRWTFPQASEEYGTEFSYLFQGNE